MGLFHLWCVSGDHGIITGVTASEKAAAVFAGLIVAGLLSILGMNPTLAVILGFWIGCAAAGNLRRQNRQNPPESPPDI